MLRQSLKFKLAGTVCLLLAAFLAVFGAATLYFFSKEFRDFIGREQFAMVSEAAADLDQQLEHGKELIVHLAAGIPPAILRHPDQIQAYLDRRFTVATTEFFDNGLSYLSPQGGLLAAWPLQKESGAQDFAASPWFRRTVSDKSPTLSAPYPSMRGQTHPVIIFSAPVLAPNGQLAGILAGSMDLKRNPFLERLFHTRIGTTGYFYLFNPDRLMILHPDPRRILQHDIPPGANHLLDRALEGFNGSGETINSRGVPMVTSFKHLSATDWILAANFPQAEAYAPLNRAQKYAFAGILGALLLGTLLFWLVLRRQIRPLLQLTRQVRRLVEQPDSRTPLNIDSRDEIGALADAFNRLLAEVGEQTDLSRERLDHLQTILDSIPVPVFYKDLRSRYLGCNAAFELAHGISRGELGGKTVRDLIPAAAAAVHERIDAELLPQTESLVRSFEQTLVLADGEEHDVLFFKAAYRDSHGEPAGLVGTMIDITERKAIEAALAEQREFSENLLQNSAVPCFVLDRQHRVLTWTRACEELSGIPAQEVLGSDRHWQAFYDRPRPCLADLVLDNNLEQTLDLYSAFGDSQLIPEGLQAEGWFPQVGGRPRYLVFEAAPIRNHQGEVIAAIETLQDLTRLKQAEQALRESEQSYRSLIDRSPDAVLVHREGRILFGNRAASRLFGADDPQQLTDREIGDLFVAERRDAVLDQLRQAEAEQVDLPYAEERISRFDGTAVVVEISSTPVHYGSQWALQSILRDITERKELQEKVWRQANFDTLTGLPNRMLFHDRLRQSLARAKREGYQVAVLFIDLDRFKEVNDTLGHEAGDCLLREAGARLAQSVRQSDTVARLGGDEFTVIMPAVVEPPHVSIVARRILATLAQPFPLPNGSGQISASIGIALYPTDAGDLDTLLARADQAMYRAKQAGRNGFCFVGEEDPERAE